MNKILIPLVIEVSAGNGTETSDVQTLEVPEKLVLEYIADNVDEFNAFVDLELCLWEQAIEHAQSYGIEKGEEGFYGEGEEEGDAEEPYTVIHGIYNPNVHDVYRSGGGSFIGENGIKEAHDNYIAFLENIVKD